MFKNSSDNINLCLKGKDTWLFLGNGYADIIDKLQGGVKLSGLKLNRLTEKYVKIKEMSEIVGAEFYMFIGPNKSSVYPEYLPPIVFPSTQRYLSPLFKSLKEKGVDVYDPTLALIKAKQVSSTFFYYKTDTHWNSLGGYLAFEGFRELIGLPSLPPLSFIDGPPVNGDLINIGGYVNFPLSSATNDNPLSVWATPLNVIEEEQGLAINSNPISDKIVWIFGDSFNIALKPYFIAMFKEIHIFKHRNFEKIISSERPKPDLIVWIIVERNVDEI
ncbi:MAG: hypothetical protein LBV23_01995 [Deltaproteobacteria bacterium]|nr:hypothetical protein [Deltaproteobacteria bacterium]